MNTSIVNRIRGIPGSLLYITLLLYEHLPVNCVNLVDSVMLTEWFSNVNGIVFAVLL